MKPIVVLTAGLMLLALAGCQSFPQQSQGAAASTTSQAPASASTAGASAGGVGQGTSLQAASAAQPPAAGPESPYKARVIYFDFNKSIIKPAFFPILKKQAAYLMAHSNAHVLLEGYTDDRGTWDYNIGLGARRAAAVRKFLLLQGVNAKQINTISYGEAYPADPKNTPKAWAKNRRVVIKYTANAPHSNAAENGSQS